MAMVEMMEVFILSLGRWVGMVTRCCNELMRLRLSATNIFCLLIREEYQALYRTCQLAELPKF